MEEKNVSLFDKNIISDIIILSELKNINPKNVREYFSFKPIEYNKHSLNPFNLDDDDETKISLIDKDIKEKKNRLINESLELYYKIDNEKIKELESTFSEMKLKIKFDNIPKILKNGQFYTLSKDQFIIYDNKYYNKLIEIFFDKQINPISVIQLDNNDLIFNSENSILIYRLKNKEYFLFQEIEDEGLGYEIKYGNHGWCGNSAYRIQYKIQYLKEISGNRFICINKYGFKIYSLNEKSEYDCILLNEHMNDIKIIHEINKNEFIFCTKKSNEDTYIGDNQILIDIIQLKEINKEELDEKHLNLITNGYHLNRGLFFFYTYDRDEEKIKQYNNEIEILLNKLKFSCSIRTISNYRDKYKNIYYLSDFVILKNKYFVLMINNIIIIYDLINGNELKKYQILVDGIFDGKDSLFIIDFFIIKKWYNYEDNEFIVITNKNVILFELNEEEKDVINLKILGFSYFPNILASNSMSKLSEKNNTFYCYDKQSDNIIYLY